MLKIRLTSWGWWSVIFAALVCGAVTLTIDCVPLYGWFVHSHRLGAQVGWSAKQVIAYYLRLLGYLQIPGVQLSHTLPMTTKAVVHFHQVKVLMVANNCLTCGLIPAAWFSWHRLGVRHERWLLLRPLAWTTLGLVMVVGWMCLDFNSFFITFHQVLFRNSDWLFNPRTAPVIKLLPESFFAASFGLVIGLVGIGIVVIWRSCRRELVDEEPEELK